MFEIILYIGCLKEYYRMLDTNTYLPLFDMMQISLSNQCIYAIMLHMNPLTSQRDKNLSKGHWSCQDRLTLLTAFTLFRMLMGMNILFAHSLDING